MEDILIFCLGFITGTLVTSILILLGRLVEMSEEVIKR